MNPPLTLGRIDFGPMHKFAVGFDDFFETMSRLQETSNQTNYPPYNIVKYSSDDYAIEFAVAGFDYNDIDISMSGSNLTVTGQKKDVDSQVEYLYRGISSRSFTRTLTLGDYLVVKDAVVKNGMLYIKLERIVPETLKARKIAITSGD